MGCGNSTNASTEEEVSTHRRIEKELRQQQKESLTEIKVLLLGAGDTGKSTLIKQIKLIYKTGFTMEDRQLFRHVIATNILSWIHALIMAVDDQDADWDSANLKKEAYTLTSLIEGKDHQPTIEERFEILSDSREVVAALWKSKCIQKMFTSSTNYQVGESASYFFDMIDRVAFSDYIPTDEDILYARARTTGVSETVFESNGRNFKVVDVGGQRAERRKWMHQFQHVTTVIFFASLSEYNLGLYEAPGVNRTKESMKLFSEIINCIWFKSTPIILFLNKSDLFKEKISKHPLSAYFPDYTGGDDYQKGCEFMSKVFVSLNQNDSRQVYPHITCCTDTAQVKKILKSVQDVIMRTAWASSFDCDGL